MAAARHRVSCCSDIGETRLAAYVGPGDVIHVGAGQTLRVTALVPVEEPDSPYAGFLSVEPDPPTNGRLRVDRARRV